MARIAVGGFHHETNTFTPGLTDFAYFTVQRDRPPLIRGDDLFAWMPSAGYPLSAFLDVLAGQHEVLPLVWTSGGAGATVSRDAFERIAGEMVGRLSLALPVDAVYLDLHGAMVTEDFEDGEGELLRRVRAAVGPETPIVVSVDYHATLTPAILALADAVTAFRTYPHVDRRETGERAAARVAWVLAHGRPAGRALRKLPFLIPLHAQCTEALPSAAIIAETERIESAARASGLIGLDYLAGFPPSDIWWCGPSVIAYATSQATADAAADELARVIALAEPEFAQPVLSPDQAVAEAMRIAAAATRPVIIADTQDNPGAGGSADTTGLLAALVAAGAEGAALGYVCDAEVAETAHRAGEGKMLDLALGGRHGPEGVVPFAGRFEVVRLGSGRFRTTGPVAGGRDADLGRMALLRIGGVSIAVTSKRMQAHDQAPFRHLGIDPARQRILALKSSVHFRADFAPLAETVIVTAAPGHHLADNRAFPYRRLRPGLRLTPLGPDSDSVSGNPRDAPAARPRHPR
ncbi:M81 family metallopeptidase [Elioraea sp.]|uniref:M81 family metallopeptidase n=1 Tax=Elioraea sp. TaxID=2185103 RepID=UPI003F70C9A2